MTFTKLLQPVILFPILLVSCSDAPVDRTATAKEEILKAETAFAAMAEQKGIAEAFAYYADSNAVIKRGKDSLIKGQEAIRTFYSADFYKSASVKWSPDFIDASANGELGYTFGKYTWQSKDSTGKINEVKGVFHTVWKKQKDGNWKYVWD